MDSLIYLYGVVPAETAAPPAELRGIEGEPVSLIGVGAVAAAVSEIPAAEYLDDVLETHLSDLSWVGDRGMAHERVLDWFMERGPVIPLSLFSLHHGADRVRDRFTPESERLNGLLGRLRGRQEWGVKLWRRDSGLRQHIDALSPTLKLYAAEMEQANPGRRFLLEKKMETVRTDELRTVARRVAHQSYAMLQEAAEQATTIPIPPTNNESGRALVLHSAFLVSEDGFSEFQERVTRVAHEFGRVGFEVEFTGPWPPYHFVEQDGG
ncbi:GvpL/GvpF family gas vesicle protein [soil metagenome]